MLKVLFIQNCEIENLGFYKNYFNEKNISLEIVHSYREPLPSSSDYDFLIIGGTPDSAYEREKYPYLNRVFQYIKEAVYLKKPCFGICCGAQILAMVLGKNVFPNDVMEIGCYDVGKTPDGEDDPLLSQFPKNFTVFQWHGDTFEIPTKAKHLVFGEKCINQLFRYGNHVGIQFHLEVSADDANIWANKYSDELAEVNKTKNQIVKECKTHEKKMKEHAYLLMNNYIHLILNVLDRTNLEF